MGRLIRNIVLLFSLLAIAACGPGLYRWDGGARTEGNPRAEKTYTVQQGDTLYSIAFRYGLDYRRLAEWNGVSESYLIHPGDELRLLPPGDDGSRLVESATTRTARRTEASAVPVDTRPVPTAATVKGGWQWPHGGNLIARFGEDNGTGGKGVDIEGIVGDPVVATAAGKVVYAGSGLVGYGKIIIVKHSEKYLSAYGHNSELFVREGEQVEQGDRIAAMGRGPGNRPLLHFEIRLNGKAVDPLEYLPNR
ncbi:MAG: peptidoglycan DD-metalloendopeptidase family protein [Gammaproteobacteria bacterium]|nr:peptidoglycan DD-metalloendopeptidase family protein [Gammaproteobacteria bacterium]